MLHKIVVNVHKIFIHLIPLKKMKLKLLTLSLLTGALIFNACRKDVTTPTLEVSKILKKPLTDDEKLLKLKLEQTAMIIAEVIKDKSILNELKQQVGKKISITKNEESLTFKELFSKPEEIKTESNNSNTKKIFTMDASIATRFKERY